MGELVKHTDAIVARVDKARALLAEARDATDAKKVADLGQAAKVYAQRQKLGREAVGYANAIIVDAMTLMGEMLKAAEKNKGVRLNGRDKVGGTRVEPPKIPAPTLAESGISKKESSQAQALAAIKEKAPELHEQIRAGKTSVGKARVELKREEKREELRERAEAAAGELAAGGRPWEVLTGDCVGHLRSLPPGSADLVFADPPYNIGFDYGAGYDDARDDGDYLGWVRTWLAECSRVLAADGSMWVLINDEYAAEYAAALRRHVAVRNWVIWYETFGVNCTDKFNRTKRHLFYCVKDPRRFAFHPDAVTRPSDRQAKYNDPRASPAGKLLDDVWLDVPRLVGTAAERLPDFPTQLPLALVRRVVACSSDPGDLVLDPFSGSGTTGVAAVGLGRRFLGIERNPSYADLSARRLLAAAADAA